MKRTVKKKEGTLRWKKTGGGSFHFNNTIIKPGQIFTAHPDEIPEAFRDIIIPMEAIPEDIEIPEVAEMVFTIQEIEDSTKVNIIDSNEKVINEKPLTKTAAKKLIKELQK